MKNIIAFAGCSALLTLTVGCSQPVVRANNFKELELPYRTVQGQHSHHPVIFQEAAHIMHGPGHHHIGFDNCPVCPQPGKVDYWKPTHHHTWETKIPKNLRYPPANQPPAIIQYPYYTVKGPDDFFFEG